MSVLSVAKTLFGRVQPGRSWTVKDYLVEANLAFWARLVLKKECGYPDLVLSLDHEATPCTSWARFIRCETIGEDDEGSFRKQWVLYRVLDENISRAFVIGLEGILQGDGNYADTSWDKTYQALARMFATMATTGSEDFEEFYGQC